jgi:hypothetical protein
MEASFVPEDKWNREQLRVVVFVQEKRARRVLAVGSLPL